LASAARARSLDKVLDWHLPHFPAADFALLANDGENGLNGGYEDGYSRCPCFWGRSAGSLVQRFVSDYSFARGFRVLDLGSGEGKNTSAFATAGAVVVAVDCSALGLANGQREFAGSTIEWILSDAETYLRECEPFDVIVMYGLLHCLPPTAAITSVVEQALRKTNGGGYHIVAAFNDGPHDLTAHPGFVPTLASHEFYLHQYRGHEIVVDFTEIIHETHPHNLIPHFHSLTRLMARKST
jgi:tellurite methyltransferase